MKRYYTRACNFYYGNESKILVRKKKSLPLNGNKEISFETFKKQVLEDYRIIVTSREASLLGRREVLSGKAKFGIFGDGKELPQIALAKVFQNGEP